MGIFGSDQNVVAATFVARDQASKTVKTLRDNIKQVGTRAGGPLGGLLGGIAGIPGPALLAGAAIGGLTAFLGGAARAAMDEEKNVAKMGAALRANVADWDGNTDAIERTIAEREKLAFSDDDLRDSLSQLVFVTKDVDEAVRGQALAMDLARAKNMSLTDASVLVGKVMGGNVSILKRYGIQLKKGATATEALAELQRQFGGQAAAYAETTAGSMESMQIALADVVEDIGTALLPMLKDLAIFARDEVVPAIRGIGDALGTVGDAVGDFKTNFAPEKQAVEQAKRDYLSSLPTRQDVEARLADLRNLDFVKEGFSSLQGTLFELDVQGVKTTWRSQINELELYLQSHKFDASGVIDTEPLEELDAKAHALAGGYVAAIALGIEQATPEVTEAVEDLTQSMKWRQMAYDADQAAFKAMGNVADTIRGNKDTVKSAMDDLIFTMTHPLKRLKEIARVEGLLAGNRLASGLASSDPGVRAQAMATQQILIDQWEKLTGKSWNAGLAAGNAFARAYKSGAKYILGPLLKTIAGGGGSTGVAGENFSGGGRQHGGPVRAGVPYIVGETQPELFVPRQDGYIMPSVSQAPAQSLPPVIVNIDGYELFRIMDARFGRGLAQTSRSAYSRG